LRAIAASIFQSLRIRNYRIWAAGALASNIGTGIQRTAQDWLVLVVLTRGSASALGVVMALQFAPQLLFLPWTGSAADHLDQRKLLMATQASMGILALLLGALTLAGAVHLWHVYIFAFVFGTAAAFDAPVRQIFVSQLVGDEDLPNAVTLNTMSFNVASLIGPAVSGALIAGIGTGWAFVLNGASFFAVLASLFLLRKDELRRHRDTVRTRGSFIDGLRYVAGRPDLIAILVMLFLVGTFALNFPIFIATMAVKVFHADARGFGALSSAMAVGAMAAVLWSARSGRPTFVTLIWSAALLGTGFTLGGVSPTYWTFAASLALIGIGYLTFVNATNPIMQLSTEPSMRGRVMALRIGIGLGATPVGAPIVGWIADHFGPPLVARRRGRGGFRCSSGRWIRYREKQATCCDPVNGGVQAEMRCKDRDEACTCLGRLVRARAAIPPSLSRDPQRRTEPLAFRSTASLESNRRMIAAEFLDENVLSDFGASSRDASGLHENDQSMQRAPQQFGREYRFLPIRPERDEQGIESRPHCRWRCLLGK
jgi:MFS family permease